MEELLKSLDIREHFKDNHAVALTRVVKMFSKKDMKIVEIGSWKGFSTYFLAKAVEDCNGKVYAIDHWKEKGILELFKHNMEKLGVSERIEPIKEDSITASNKFENESLDFIFIDGDHRYHNFKQDIWSWLPKLKDGGIICGHDCEKYYDDYPQEVKDKINSSLSEDYIRYVGHPGIIKVLNEFFGKDYIIMPRSSIWFHKVSKESKESKERLSVIISAYNNHPLTVVHVRECMKSTRVPDEIIVVNDGGTPDLREKLMELEKKTKIIYAEILPPKILWNYTGSRNLGFWISKGDFISIEDNDHIVDKYYYEEALKKLYENPDCGKCLAFHRWTIFESDILNKPIEEWEKIHKTIPHHDVAVLRRETYIQLKGYDERFAGEYGWCSTDWRRRSDRIGIKSCNAGWQYVVSSPKTRGLSWRNYRLAREKDGHTQSPIGLLNFKYSVCEL